MTAHFLKMMRTLTELKMGRLRALKPQGYDAARRGHAASEALLLESTERKDGGFHHLMIPWICWMHGQRGK
jgi:hypothetical protein